MIDPGAPDWWARARADLSAADPVLGAVIARCGDAALVSRGDPFTTLARAIVGQQISVKAAQSVWNRFAAAAAQAVGTAGAAVGQVAPGAGASTSALAAAASAGTGAPAAAANAGAAACATAVPVPASGVVAVVPAQVLALDVASLRACGLSARKAEYLLDLATRFDRGDVDPHRWPSMDDEAVITELVEVRGIGRWTAEMFLIFNLLRPDVLPLDDIGLLRAIGRGWLDGATPTRAQARAIAQAWQPWRTAATWYLWRSLDPVPVEY